MDANRALSTIIPSILEFAKNNVDDSLEEACRSYLTGGEDGYRSGAVPVPLHIQARSIRFYMGLRQELNTDAVRLGAWTPANVLQMMSSDPQNWPTISVTMPMSITQIEYSASTAVKDGLMIYQCPASNLNGQDPGDKRRIPCYASADAYSSMLTSIRTDLIRRLEPMCT
jgi:hypothetical protein